MHNTLIIPPSVIASWPAPNYVDPVTRGNGLSNVCAIFGALSILVIGVRLHSRIFITRTFGIDDILALLALILTIVFSVLAIVTVRDHGIGRHIWDVPATMFADERRNLWIATWCYYTASLAIKSSVLLFYRRLSISFSRTFKYAIWAGIVFNIAYTIACLLAISFQCQPTVSYWSAYEPGWASTHKYHCGNESVNLVVSVSLSMFSDVYSTILPIALILSIDLPNTKKGPIYALFGVGFFVVGAGTARAVILAEMVTSTYDFTWKIWDFWLWTLVELYVAIVAASMPAIKAWVMKWAVSNVTTVTKSLQSSSREQETSKLETDSSFDRTKGLHDASA